MKTERKYPQEQPGRFLRQRDQEAIQQQYRSRRIQRCRQYMTVFVLLLWDGLLLYMIIGCLIDEIYGAIFMSVVSVALGYHIK